MLVNMVLVLELQKASEKKKKRMENTFLLMEQDTDLSTIIFFFAKF